MDLLSSFEDTTLNGLINGFRSSWSSVEEASIRLGVVGPGGTVMGSGGC